MSVMYPYRPSTLIRQNRGEIRWESSAVMTISSALDRITKGWARFDGTRWFTFGNETKLFSTVELAYNKHEGTAIFPRYYKVLKKTGSCKNHKFILTKLYFIFDLCTVQKKMVNLLYIVLLSLSCVFALQRSFMARITSSFATRVGKNSEVFLHTQKPLSMLSDLWPITNFQLNSEC